MLLLASCIERRNINLVYKEAMQDSPFQVGIIKSFNVICVLSCVLSSKLNDTFHVIKTFLHFLTQVNMFP